jgi:hypothetical protein
MISFFEHVDEKEEAADRTLTTEMKRPSVQVGGVGGQEARQKVASPKLRCNKKVHTVTYMQNEVAKMSHQFSC